MYGIPRNKVCNDENSGEDYDDVEWINFHWVGFDNECTVFVAKFQKSEVLLQQTEGEADEYAERCSKETYHSAFYQEDVSYLFVGGSEISQSGNVFFLLISVPLILLLPSYQNEM